MKYLTDVLSYNYFFLIHLIFRIIKIWKFWLSFFLLLKYLTLILHCYFLILFSTLFKSFKFFFYYYSLCIYLLLCRFFYSIVHLYYGFSKYATIVLHKKIIKYTNNLRNLSNCKRFQQRPKEIARIYASYKLLYIHILFKKLFFSFIYSLKKNES